MVNGKNMNFAKTLQIEKFAKFGVCSIYRFYDIINFPSQGQRKPNPLPPSPGLNRVKRTYFADRLQTPSQKFDVNLKFRKIKGKAPVPESQVHAGYLDTSTIVFSDVSRGIPLLLLPINR